MARNKRYRQMADINVVPYIDVMLVLLVIFMITAPMLSQGVDVDLPTATTRPLNTNATEPVIVSVDAKGSYYVNISKYPDKAVSANDLVMQISSVIMPKLKSSQRPVLVKGDKNVDYGKVVEVMVLLQRAGVENVGLVTQIGS